MTIAALSRNQSWPNVTVPNFDLRFQRMENVTGVGVQLAVPIVSDDKVDEWLAYSWEHQGWLDIDLKYRGLTDLIPDNISQTIYPFDDREVSDLPAGFPIKVPVWQIGPVPIDSSLLNLDLYTHPVFRQLITQVLKTRQQLLSPVLDLDWLLVYADSEHKADGQPRSFLIEPVFDDFYNTSSVTGFVISVVRWELFLVDILPTGSNGLLVEVEGNCGNGFTYLINGRDATFLGYHYEHEDRYLSFKQTYEFANFAPYDSSNHAHDICFFHISTYPTATLEKNYKTNKPALYTSVIVLVFFFTALVFLIYDYLVHIRQTKLMSTAQRTNAIVASLFPKEVQQRIMAEAAKQANLDEAAKRGPLRELLHGEEKTVDTTSRPIADLFPEVTIMFADIVGFTAWSSMLEPAQVFTLLESIFGAYDEIAKRRRVFKVETVGDCYVAVVGLPEPRKDHATVIARFAKDCLVKMSSLLIELADTLGPDTLELGMRFGLHSGPVTAGVLRGEKARFQLFGDTMNTTARIETTGKPNKIHLSQETADLLMAAGKGHWLRARDDQVVAKGKGKLATYWLEISGEATKSSDSGETTGTYDEDDVGVEVKPEVKGEVPMEMAPVVVAEKGVLSDKYLRLASWNAEILAKVLREIIARREGAGVKADSAAKMRIVEREQLSSDLIVLEEMVEVIKLPDFDASATKNSRGAAKVDLGETVMSQLQHYIHTITAMYRDNPFHNFEHASHVTMSVVKLLSRIVAPQIKSSDENNTAKDLHDHTYGITSDPLTQFAVILSAVIHDVDHTGVPNMQLLNEQASIAAVYKNKSVAEQNSVDIAWELLMQDEFADLRRTIYTTSDEFKRFRQLVVNSVLATDIMDKELSMARKARWNKAFEDDIDLDEAPDAAINRKATIVIEHLIQASDVAHTMQHWHIYRKWNARLFEEMYKAYAEGCAEKDPSENWYEGEIGFFDYYIIPLAMKLKSCGVSSDEYLNYAQQNRKAWVAKGREIVAEAVLSMNYNKMITGFEARPMESEPVQAAKVASIA